MANQVFRSVTGWFVRYWADLTRFGVGFALLETFNHAYDFGFFPFALHTWGPFWGAIIVTAGAYAFNAFMYFLYDVMKVDWLQAYATSELADKENKNTLEKAITWFRTPKVTLKDKVLAVGLFVSLTLPIDPMILAIYYRQSYFKGVNGRDWGLLIAATTSACILWLFVWEPGVWFAKFAYHQAHLWLLAH